MLGDIINYFLISMYKQPYIQTRLSEVFLIFEPITYYSFC